MCLIRRIKNQAADIPLNSSCCQTHLAPTAILIYFSLVRWAVSLSLSLSLHLFRTKFLYFSHFPCSPLSITAFYIASFAWEKPSLPLSSPLLIFFIFLSSSFSYLPPSLYFFAFETFFYYFFYCSGFCHTLKWNSHGFTCIPHPDPPSHLPLHPIPPGLPSAPGPSACLMHPTWAGDLFHPR